MKRLTYFVAFALISAAAATANAQEAPPAAPAAAPAAAPMEHPSHPLVGGPIGYFTAATINSASDSTLQFGISGGPGFSIGVGINFTYNSLALSAQTPNDKFQFGFLVDAAYYVYNKFPLAMGPEIAITADVAPSASAFNPLTIVPGWQFLYAPFNAPVLLGTALDVPILLFTKNSGPTVITSLEPELRVIYAF